MMTLDMIGAAVLCLVFAYGLCKFADTKCDSGWVGHGEDAE